MNIKSLILAITLAVPSIVVINIESALSITKRPIGRTYVLPANPSISGTFLEDSNGDAILDLQITRFPRPRFEFSILTELDNQLITDQNNSADVGFFPNAISSFTYVEEDIEIVAKIADDQGNSIPPQEISNQAISVSSNNFLNGDLRVEQVDNSGIIYEFNFGGDFIQFLLPEFANIDSLLAVNDISYLVNQNLFGQEMFVDDLVVFDTSFRTNGFNFRGNQPESSVIFVSQSVPESSNKLSLLTLGLICIGLFSRDK